MPSHTDLIGKPAPAFALPNSDGETYEFTPGADGKPTALLFYPQSGSYGCTQQICQFRNAVVDKISFSPATARIIGISTDPVDKQKTFVETNKIPFPVLSDVNKEVVGQYHVGRGMLGMVPVARVSVIVDGHGVVRDTLDATMNYSAHEGFVEKWFLKLKEEEEETSAGGGGVTPSATATATAPEAA